MAERRSEWLSFYSMLQKPRRRYVQYAIGESLIRSVVPIVTAFALKWTIDSSVSEDMNMLWKTFYILCGSTLLFAALSPLLVYRLKRSAKQLSIGIRGRLIDKVAFLSFPFFERHESGELMSKMSNDVLQMEEMYTEHMRNLVHYTIVGAGSFAAMLFLDWRFALSLIALTVVIGVVNYRFLRPLRTLSDTLQQRKGEANARCSDLLHGLSTIKLYQLEAVVINQYDKKNREIQYLTSRFGRQSAWLEAVNYLLTFISFGGIAVAGTILVLRDSIETGSLIALIQLQMNVTFVIMLMGGLFARMQVSITASERVNGLLETEEEEHVIVEGGMIHSEGTIDFAIEFDDVFFSYDQRSVLRGVSMSVRSGETAVITGGSGNGKSTLCKLLLGFYRPDSGSIRLLGDDFSQCSLADWRSKIAYVPQEPFLFSGTIEDNIRFGNLEASDEDVRAAAAAAGAHDFIESLPDGYGTNIAQDASNLSGGQKQRITIARAFLKDAPILLLDEPSSSLDAAAANAVADVVNSMRGIKTCLVIAHESKSRYRVDVAYCIEEGKVYQPYSEMKVGSS
ncbi:ABC transporter ATP-binding protein [Cohnella sp. WQ 127256]|uniref:ABC transporter ATP-binding protein n=1 Tax=Cohnella sp. WQ 127256 TaxID=2938790 RepID=UPI00211927FA|nr:ABC transporter ATP-binding protein [Cohnella sp. WQ 127256]